MTTNWEDITTESMLMTDEEIYESAEEVYAMLVDLIPEDTPLNVKSVMLSNITAIFCKAYMISMERESDL